MTRRLSHRRIGWRLHRDPRGRQMLVVFRPIAGRVSSGRSRLGAQAMDRRWPAPDSQPSASEAAAAAKEAARPMRLPKGITLRITLLGWLVTLVTLAVFVTVIIPEQKREFELSLESKARA